MEKVFVFCSAVIPVNRNFPPIGEAHPLSNKVDIGVEPLALESVATYDLSPSQSVNITMDEEPPSINSKPVLTFHPKSLGKNKDEGNLNYSRIFKLLFIVCLNKVFFANTGSSDEKTPSTRHRRRLTLQIPQQEALKTTSPRPPKDFIIYSLPEQSFWPDNSLYKDNKVQQSQEENSSSEEMEENSTTTPKINKDSEEINATSSNSESNFVGNDSATTTASASSTTTTTSTASPTATTKLGMTLGEKKFHLSQCMRYCMDAIL